MSQEHAAHDNLFFLDPQTITLPDLNANGYILDIGGGGEGVIGQLKGDQVIAIDRRKAELEEASSHHSPAHTYHRDRIRHKVACRGKEPRYLLQPGC